MINHFYMNLPGLAIEFLDVFPQFFKGKPLNKVFSGFFDKEPLVHVYCFTSEEDSEKEIHRRIKEQMPFFKEEDVVEIHELKQVSMNKQMMCTTFR